MLDSKTKHRFGIDTDHFSVFLLVSDSRSGSDLEAESKDFQVFTFRRIF